MLRSMRRLGVTAGVAVLLGSLAVASPASAAGGGKGEESIELTAQDAAELARKVELPALLKHLSEFQAIADANGNTRTSGTPGYDRSADRVEKLLKEAGYQVSRQSFPFDFCSVKTSSFVQNSPVPATYEKEKDYDAAGCTGAGTVTGRVVPVDVQLTTPNTSTSGCEESDFTGVAGNIALIQRGTCQFVQKVANAKAAGASAVILFNQGNTAEKDRQDLFGAGLGGPPGIPVVVVSYAQGAAFAVTTDLNVTISVDALAEKRQTENVIAESPHGDPANVVMAGAHLDSVEDGAGINDNATGSAAVLETALQLGGYRTRNKLRFAWWGAEEFGLIGSKHYVAGLSAEDRAKISLYLNFDMLGSPNYRFGVYDGDGSGKEGAKPGPAGSDQIEAVFERFFAARNLPIAPSAFDGRSDYGPFIEAGIPAGGVDTGAEGKKTEEDVAKWGGIAGQQFDPCYHQKCDSLTPEKDGGDADVYAKLRAAYTLEGNVNTHAFDVNADAVATAVATFAADTSAIPARPAAPAEGG